jgi:hypothetical protein
MKEEQPFTVVLLLSVSDYLGFELGKGSGNGIYLWRGIGIEWFQGGSWASLDSFRFEPKRARRWVYAGGDINLTF